MTLPTAGSADEIRHIIAHDREPRHVQVLVEEGGVHLQVTDVEGPFLDVQPEEEQTDREQVTDGKSSSGGYDGQDLETTLQESRELVAHLKEEESALKAQLEKERSGAKAATSYECLTKPL